MVIQNASTVCIVKTEEKPRRIIEEFVSEFMYSDLLSIFLIKVE